MQPFFWGMGNPSGAAQLLFLPAPAPPLDTACPSWLPPARRPLSFPLSALLLPDSPAKTTLQIPPVARPKPSVSFSPGAEHPCTCLPTPSPGAADCRHPAAVRWVLLPSRHGWSQQDCRSPLPAPWGGRGRGCQPLCPTPSPSRGVYRLCPSSGPQAGMEGPPVCTGTASDAGIPAHGDVGASTWLAARWGPACALPATPLLLPASPHLLWSAPSARHVINLSDRKLLHFICHPR